MWAFQSLSRLSCLMLFKNNRVESIREKRKKYNGWIKLLLSLCFLFNSSLEANWEPDASDLGALTVSPAVALNSAGNAVAVWLQSSNQIYGAFYLNTTKLWTGTLPASSTGPINSVGPPSIGISASGKATAIWSFNGTLQSSTLPFNNLAWGGVTNIGVTLNPPSSIPASIAVDPAGNAVVVWLSSATGIVRSATLISGVWSASYHFS